jgi:hypothetical protein
MDERAFRFGMRDNAENRKPRATRMDLLVDICRGKIQHLSPFPEILQWVESYIRGYEHEGK